MATARLRDSQLALLKKLIEAEAVLAARGEQDEFVCFFAQQDTIVQHQGLADPLRVAEGDLRALGAVGALQINTSSDASWLFDLAAGVESLVEDEEAVRGTPRPTDELSALRSSVQADGNARSQRLRDLAEWLAQPARWLMFIGLAVLAGAVAGASFIATDNLTAPFLALGALGAVWGLLERISGIHVLGMAAVAHRRTADSIERWLRDRLEPPAE